MKKMAFFLVLAMTGVVNAAVIDVRIASLNGQPITPTKEITITPGDKVDFQITFNAPNTEYLFALGVKLNISGPGSLDWSIFESIRWDPIEEMWVRGEDIHPAFDFLMFQRGDDWLCVPGSARGLRGNGTEYWVIKDIQIQCNSRGDVYLWLSDYLTGSKVIDINLNEVPHQYGAGVIIHQVPACWLCPGQPYGDATGDGAVGLNDLLCLKRSWLKTTADPQGTGYGQYNCCADFTQDGSVNTSDLLRLKQGWMTVHFPCGDISCP